MKGKQRKTAIILTDVSDTCTLCMTKAREVGNKPITNSHMKNMSGHENDQHFSMSGVMNPVKFVDEKMFNK